MSEAEIDDDSASSRKLTQEEVNALISGLDDQADPSTPAMVAKEAEVSDYDFGSNDLSLLGDLYALRVINERFAKKCALSVSTAAESDTQDYIVCTQTSDI
jgi:flagellar motor switch protein FliM